ncbi:MAG: HU family DNA-binding protein [Tannerellaceae bacterium]|jgi:predicted histone-like DNA-binding protein|nr:HU family DNA-binding protein [Tannerellaceae bacterium]
MAFFKKVQQKINGLWYPQSVTVGKPVSTDQVADRLAQISTVSRADTYAVLKDLGGVMGDYMAQGRTVKLEGIGTFYYTAAANKQGVDSKDKVKASHIVGVRVRFIPETSRTASGKVATRSLISNDIFWEEWGGTDPAGEEPAEPEEPDGGDGPTEG